MTSRLFFFIALMLGFNFSFAQIFQDNFSNDTIGNFPHKWKAVKGYAQVTPISSGEKLMQMTEGMNILKPVVDGTTDNYLDDTFTLEFDAFFDETSVSRDQYYTLRLWDGSNYTNMPYRMSPIAIYRNGIMTTYFNPDKVNIQNFGANTAPKTKYNEETKTFEAAWFHIKMVYDKGSLKVFVNDEQQLIISDLPLEPSMLSIGAYEATNREKNYFTAIANVTLHDEVLAGAPPEVANIPSPEDNNVPSPSGTTTSNSNQTEAQYRFKFDWIVVYEVAEGGLGNNNLEIYSRRNLGGIGTVTTIEGGGTIRVFINNEEISAYYYTALCRIEKKNALAIAKNDGAQLPPEEITLNINAEDYGFSSIQEFEESAELRMSFECWDKDFNKDDRFYAKKTIRFSDLNIPYIPMSEVLAARNTEKKGVLKFQNGGDRIGVSFTFERTD